MRKYETVVIFDPALNDERVNEEIKKVEALITSHKGTNITVKNWGRKAIAYLVKKSKNGVFVSFDYETDNSGLIDSVTGILRITETVLRFQNHRKNERVRKFKGNPKLVGQADWGGDDFLEEAQN